MKIVEISDKNKLNNFVASQGVGQFLQSWEWGEVQKAERKEIKRLVLVEEDEIKAAGTFIKEKMPGGYYWYCPRGPILKIREYKNIKIFLEEFKKDKKALVVRVELPEQTSEDLENQLKQAGFVMPRLMIRSQSPNATTILDLSRSEEELLARMKQKTRYNIKVAQKHNVKTEESDDFEKFWGLMKITSKRNRFKLHPRVHYENILNFFADSKLFFASYQGKILATHLIVFFGKVATYVHGATSDELRNVMAPNLLHWEEIKQAKAKGMRWYDFWGINSQTRRGFPSFYQKSWEGYTRFKLGFGGEVVEYPGARDFILKPVWHNALSLFRKLKSSV